jgi:hypothetical protein
MHRTVALPLSLLWALAGGCGRVTGPSDTAVAVEYRESGFYENRALSLDASGSGALTCTNSTSHCHQTRVEVRLTPAEQAGVLAAVGAPSFRELSGIYAPDPMALCIPEQSLYTFHVTRNGVAQEVSAWDCAKPPAAFTEARLVFQAIVNRLDP